MVLFVAKRLAFIVVQLAIVVVGTFLLLRVMPVDPTSKLVGLLATDAARDQARVQLGIDTSVGNQLVTYLGDLVRGDFGVSWVTQSDVAGEIATRFPVTIQLIVIAFVVTLLIAIPVGRAAAARPGGRLDRASLSYGLFAGAQPDFWWGLMFIFVLYFQLGWFPAPLGLISPDVTPPPGVTNFVLVDALVAGQPATFLNALWHFALPVLTLAFVISGPLIKMTRQSVLSVVNSDHVLYARAAGLPKRTVQWYMLRNALAPVVTLSGILFGFMLGGAVLIETVFSIDGLGAYALSRTLATDFPAIQGVVVVMTAFSLLIYVALDVVYAVLDPRVRYQGARS